jgi:hypothetical protein
MLMRPTSSQLSLLVLVEVKMRDFSSNFDTPS